MVLTITSGSRVLGGIAQRLWQDVRRRVVGGRQHRGQFLISARLGHEPFSSVHCLLAVVGEEAAFND